MAPPDWVTQTEQERECIDRAKDVSSENPRRNARSAQKFSNWREELAAFVAEMTQLFPPGTLSPEVVAKNDLIYRDGERLSPESRSESAIRLEMDRGADLEAEGG